MLLTWRAFRLSSVGSRQSLTGSIVGVDWEILSRGDRRFLGRVHQRQRQALLPRWENQQGGYRVRL